MRSFRHIRERFALLFDRRIFIALNRLLKEKESNLAFRKVPNTKQA